MRLTIIGGGGFRVPQLYRALAADPSELVDELVLVDSDAKRLGVVDSVIRQIEERGGGSGGFESGVETRAGNGVVVATSGPGGRRPLRVRTTTAWEEGLDGADFVFSAIRVGGTEGRALDESIALSHGLLGQETVGVGGMAYALRSIPVARDLAAAIRRHAPGAWTINFTNPAGIITQAMRETLGESVIGICDTPIGLVNRIADITGTAVTDFDYVGLNHLGWLRGARGRGEAGTVDLLARVLGRDALLGQIEEARLFGFDVVRSVGALPNEYLYYYWQHRDSRARISGRTARGAQLREQQGAFYAAASEAPGNALELWSAALAEREATYGAETREDPLERRSAHEIELGGYQKVAVQLMRVLSGAEPPTRMILNVRNEGPGGARAIPQLTADAVVEVGCDVAAGAPGVVDGTDGTRGAGGGDGRGVVDGTRGAGGGDGRGVVDGAQGAGGGDRRGVVDGTQGSGDGDRRIAVRALPTDPLPSDLAGLMVQVKGCDELLLAATAQRDPVLALRAFAEHPLVDSLAVARRVLDEYCARIPGVGAAIGRG